MEVRELCADCNKRGGCWRQRPNMKATQTREYSVWNNLLEVEMVFRDGHPEEEVWLTLRIHSEDVKVKGERV